MKRWLTKLILKFIDIKILELKPDDILCLHLTGRISNNNADKLTEILKEKINNTNKIIVLGEGSYFSILSSKL